MAAAVFVVMDTWRVGRRVYAEKVREGSLALDLFLDRADKMTQRVAGTAIFMSARSDMVPGALLHRDADPESPAAADGYLYDCVVFSEPA